MISLVSHAETVRTVNAHIYWYLGVHEVDHTGEPYGWASPVACFTARVQRCDNPCCDCTEESTQQLVRDKLLTWKNYSSDQPNVEVRTTTQCEPHAADGPCPCQRCTRAEPAA